MIEFFSPLVNVLSVKNHLHATFRSVRACVDVGVLLSVWQQQQQQQHAGQLHLPDGGSGNAELVFGDTSTIRREWRGGG